MERLFSQISGGSFHVFISQIVVDETISQIYEKCGRTRPDDLFERFASLVEKYGWRNANMPPLSNRSFHIMHELLNVDNRLTGTDLAILAQALADKDSKFLFTRDRTPLSNKGVCD